MRKFWLVPIALFVLSAAASAAEPEQDSASAVERDCSAPDLAAASLDSCLERVRILEETDSSPGLTSLEARLEARVSADHEPLSAPPPTVAPTNSAVEVQPYGASPASESGPVAQEGASPGGTATSAPRPLQQWDGPAAAPGDDAVSGSDDRMDTDGSGAAGAAAADDPPPDLSPDDEPPVADPPDGSASSGADADSVPPG